MKKLLSYVSFSDLFSHNICWFEIVGLRPFMDMARN
jgi:hypothetical protein